jgi:outer membrane protein
MMKRNHLLAITIGLIFIAAANTAGAFGLEFAIGGWAQGLSGTLGYKALSADDILDVEQDLKYDDEDRVSARLSIDMPLFLPNIYLMATPMDFAATGVKTDGFKFGDVSFNPGPFYSETVLDNLDIGLYYGIPLLQTATFDTFNIDVGVNVRIYDYELKIRQDSSGLSESETGTFPIPMIFLAARFRPIERLSFEAEGRGISYSGNDVYSLIGRVKVRIVGPLFAAGGYRYEKAKLDEKDVLADVEFSGPFLEAGFSF